MLKYLPLVGLGVAYVSGQFDYVSECPEENGLFADALQCDRYYECIDGVVSEQFCPDGLVFDEASVSYAKCGFPFSVDCTGRDERQPAQATFGCPHQHGYFAIPDETVCNKFNFCVDGVPNTITCAGGLIFDPEKGQCAYSDQTTRVGCTSGDLFGFRCPEENLGAQGYSRHSDPEDCQFFYLCIEGKARRNGCSIGDVFDPTSLQCQRQDKVDGACGSWYNQTFIESLNRPPPKPTALTANRQLVNQENRRRPSRPATPRRQQASQEQVPQEQIPQQLADLERFGQPKANRAPSFGQNFQEQPAVNNRVNPAAGRGRVRSQVPRRPAQQQQQDTPRLQSDERESFFNNLRSNTRQEKTTQTPFTRPPRRRPQRPEVEPQVVESPRFIEAAVPAVPAQDSNFGQRQNFQSRRQPSREPLEDPNNGIDLLEQVEAELARREQNSNQNLGPSDLDALLSRNQPSQQEEPILPEPVSRQRVSATRGGSFSRGGGGNRGSQSRGSQSRGAVRRVPISRGGGSRRGAVDAVPQDSEVEEALDVNRQTGRGRLQVIENRRPPLQRFEEDETEFENFGRQRNRG